MVAAAEFLGMPAATVYGVASFYAQFYFTRQGRNKIRICTGTACHVRGGSSVMRTVRKRLGIGPGETTPDYEFSLERVACLGSCALAPVMMVNDKVYGAMTTTKVERLIEELQDGSGASAAADAADGQAHGATDPE
jgi:NADH-quinone oxidoreductase subunit E